MNRNCRLRWRSSKMLFSKKSKTTTQSLWTSASATRFVEVSLWLSGWWLTPWAAKKTDVPCFALCRTKKAVGVVTLHIKSGTGDLLRRVGAKSTGSESLEILSLCLFLTFKIWYAVNKEYGFYLPFLFLLGKQPSSHSMYLSGVISPAEHSSRLTSASYFHFLKSFFLIWLTFTRAK